MGVAGPVRMILLSAEGGGPWRRDAFYGFDKGQNRKNGFDGLVVSGSGFARSMQ